MLGLVTSEPRGLQLPFDVSDHRWTGTVSKPAIMLVEDEPGLVTLLTHILKTLDVQIVSAYGGEQALHLLENGSPDLLILDLAMPGVNGQDVLRYVRSQRRLDAMKVMILTVRTVDPVVDALGYDSWISKPVMPQPFVDAVRNLLNGN